MLWDYINAEQSSILMLIY